MGFEYEAYDPKDIIPPKIMFEKILKSLDQGNGSVLEY